MTQACQDLLDHPDHLAVQVLKGQEAYLDQKATWVLLEIRVLKDQRDFKELVETLDFQGHWDQMDLLDQLVHLEGQERRVFLVHKVLKVLPVLRELLEIEVTLVQLAQLGMLVATVLWVHQDLKVHLVALVLQELLDNKGKEVKLVCRVHKAQRDQWVQLGQWDSVDRMAP